MAEPDLDCVVVGAGLAGLSCALDVARAGGRVVVLDGSDTPGAKFVATGGEESPLSTQSMNVERFHGRDARFVTDALRTTDNDALDAWWNELGVTLNDYEHYDMRVPHDGGVDAFVSLVEQAEDAGVVIKPNHRVTSVNPAWRVKTTTAEYSAPVLVLALGGPHQPASGGSDDGVRMCQKLGLKVRDPIPAHTSLRISDEWIRATAGVWMDVAATLMIDGKAANTRDGSLLFTDAGVTGEVVFNLSALANAALADDKHVELVLNFFHERTSDEVDAWYRDTLGPRTKERLVRAMGRMLPDDLALALAQVAGIPTKRRVLELNEHQHKTLRGLLTETRLTVAVMADWDDALNFSGGVMAREVDPRSLQSRAHEGLFVIGSLLDLDCDWGGVAQHWAVASGRQCAQTIAQRLGGR